jgi:glycosyltransferase involved in cell wall biosynthesis
MADRRLSRVRAGERSMLETARTHPHVILRPDAARQDHEVETLTVPERAHALASSAGDRSSGHVTERVVQLHFGRFVHPIYREQMHAVPAGFSYRSDHPALTDETAPTKRIVEQRARFASARTLGERLALRMLSRAGYVHRVRAKRIPEAALIHSCERLLRRSPLPYVLDFEHAELFVLYQRIALGRPWTRAWLARALEEERLRFLLPWSEAARDSLHRALGPEVGTRLDARTRVVYPAIRPAAERPRSREDEALRVLFVGTAFYEKGAVEAIRAVQRLAASHPVHLDLLSYVPQEWIRRLQDDAAITLHRPGGADVVQRLYQQADALLFPSHMDTFGYVVLEAMAHGLPTVAPGHLALNELIEDGVSGLLFAPENPLYGEDTACRFPHTLPPPRRFLEALQSPSEGYVDGVAETLCRLVEDRSLHARTAAGALDEVTSGRFSVERRRQALSEVYSAVLR